MQALRLPLRIGVLVESINNKPEFQNGHLYWNAPTSLNETITFNFDRDSDKFIRKVFNTNPALISRDSTVGVPSAQGGKTYFLGETFEQYVTKNRRSLYG